MLPRVIQLSIGIYVNQHIRADLPRVSVEDQNETRAQHGLGPRAGHLAIELPRWHAALLWRLPEKTDS